MTQRSNATLDRDHRRAVEHQAWLEINELNSVDWNSVEQYEVIDFIERLEELESELENEEMCAQISELKSLLEDLL